MLALRVAETALESYAMADDRYDEIKRYLCSLEAHEKDASDVEREIKQRCLELMRQMLQSHLNTRGRGEAVGSVCDADGVERHERRTHRRKLETVFGTVEVERIGYARDGRDSLHPLDADLNLPRELYSFELRRQVAMQAAKNSFDDTIQSVQEGTGAEVPKRQAEELVQRSARDFDAFYERRQEQAHAAPSKGSVLVLTVDGKGLPMHHKDLREATRKAANKKRRSKLLGRLTKGEKKHRKRMATVAAVYTVEPYVRTTDEFLGSLMGYEPLPERPGSERDKTRRPRPEAKRVWASVKKESHEVIEQAVLEAESRDRGHDKHWAILVDGAEHQMDLVNEFRTVYDFEATVIVDIIHVVEYVWKASLAFHAQDAPEREIWVRDRVKQILEGNPALAAAAMRRSATTLGLSKNARKAVDTCANYLHKYAPYMDYKAYLAAGLPIATGVVEGACRHLVRDRMELTGARWRLDSAEAVLQLRALHSNGDFDEYWTFHEAQEYERNHTAQYADGKAPPVRSTIDSVVRSRLRLIK